MSLRWFLDLPLDAGVLRSWVHGIRGLLKMKSNLVELSRMADAGGLRPVWGFLGDDSAVKGGVAKAPASWTHSKRWREGGRRQMKNEQRVALGLGGNSGS